MKEGRKDDMKEGRKENFNSVNATNLLLSIGPTGHCLGFIF